ncbi:hypothetical protein [Lyngbya confervoides]|uniref:Uncharacterized protein n=1 Tax=Lyngbya confervoides BDU141951 TaxID=1574623 RepID=A0ABD4SZX8_9CYAN|nr:hypothetical protein [Lyngbya confervoides]MCM1981920.1 hypothetical protein [Lyngbya confervoides BDU141951]
MMMHLRTAMISLASALVLEASFGQILISAPVDRPQTCADTGDLSPAQSTRTVRFDQFGIDVKIPSNFRTMLRNDGSVAILAPGDFNLIQCLAKGIPVQGTDAIAARTLRLRPNPKQLSVQDLAMALSASAPAPKVTHRRVNGMDVFVREDQSRLPVAYAWFQPPGIQDVVELQAPELSDLLDLLNQTQFVARGSGSSSQITASQAPVLVALAAVQNQGYSISSYSEQIVRQNDSPENPLRSTVTITQEGLLDDSVAGQQFVVTLERGAASGWTVVNVLKQWTCQPGRGHQTYLPQPCL